MTRKRRTTRRRTAKRNIRLTARSNRLTLRNKRNRTKKTRKRTNKRSRQRVRGGAFIPVDNPIKCVQIKHEDIEFFVFHNLIEYENLTDINKYDGLVLSIEQLTDKHFEDDELYPHGIHIVGLYKETTGPITIHNDNYHLLYYNLLLRDHPIRVLDKELLISLGYPRDKLIANTILTDLTDGGWPPKTSDKLTRKIIDVNWEEALPEWGKTYGFETEIEKEEYLTYLLSIMEKEERCELRKEILPGLIVSNIFINVCKACSGYIPEPKIFEYLMNNIKTDNFFKNGDNEFVNFSHIFKIENCEIKIHLNPGSNTILNQWRQMGTKNKLKEYNFCEEIFINNNDIVTRFNEDTKRLYDYYISIGFEDTNEISHFCENWTRKNTHKDQYEYKKPAIFTLSLLKYTI